MQRDLVSERGESALMLTIVYSTMKVIYRDFKSSNVLLDENFKAKLSDFGLAREGPKAGHSHVSTAVCHSFMNTHSGPYFHLQKQSFLSEFILSNSSM